jgi:Fur family ferric uptake transcriptional regulator
MRSFRKKLDRLVEIRTEMNARYGEHGHEFGPRYNHSTMRPAAAPAQILAEHGLRATDQRIAVLEAMVLEPNDVTAQSLHGRLVDASPSLGLATVYRTLNALADAGILDRLHHDSSTCFRYCRPGHHHHLICRSCHAVVELHDCDLDAWAADIAQQHGYAAVRHAVELDGVCADCTKEVS